MFQCVLQCVLQRVLQCMLQCVLQSSEVPDGLIMNIDKKVSKQHCILSKNSHSVKRAPNSVKRALQSVKMICILSKEPYILSQ